MKSLSLMLAVFLTFPVQPIQAQETNQPEKTFSLGGQKIQHGKNYMIVTAHPLATAVGRSVLETGGSAVDAAVAVQLMLNLVEPQSSGIGGGAFALYWDAQTRKLSSWDGRERAPLSATPEYWLDQEGKPLKWFDAVVGGRSVGVPGTLKLLETLHQKYGIADWSVLFDPTIALAQKGFPISKRLADSIAAAQKRQLDIFPNTKAYFFLPDGTPKPEGMILQNTAFAETLLLLADKGTEAFYSGKIAEDIVAAVKTETNSGILTMQDFAEYTVKERAPVCVEYRDHDVCGMGPPSSGGLTVGQILRLLTPFDMAELGATAAGYHHYIEAAKLAYADRELYMADADYVAMPTAGLIDTRYLQNRAQQIRSDDAMEKAIAGFPPMHTDDPLTPDTQPELAGTSHFVIADTQGNVVSMTTTIETGFGSRVMTGGFLLNNELTDFSRIPEKDGVMIANRVEGGKRPRSSMAPTIVLYDGEPKLAIGSPGGSRIINYVARSIMALLDWNMPLQQALDLGHVVNRNGATDLEEETTAIDLQEELETLGHQTAVRNLNSGLHAILWDEDTLIGAADKRREGVALGD